MDNKKADLVNVTDIDVQIWFRRYLKSAAKNGIHVNLTQIDTTDFMPMPYFTESGNMKWAKPRYPWEI